jgi:hypothetical protein
MNCVRCGVRDGRRKHCSSLSDISTSFETRVPAKRSSVEDQLERSVSAVSVVQEELESRFLNEKTEDRLIADGWMQEKP